MPPLQHLAILACLASVLAPCLATAASLPSQYAREGSGLQLEALKEQILNHVAGDLEAAWRARDMGSRQQDLAVNMAAQKRMFVPVSGLPGEMPNIKRQIRYHQCYFNPISCFRK